MWDIQEVPGGYAVQWRGRQTGTTRTTLAEAEAYLARLKERYPNGAAQFVSGKPRRVIVARNGWRWRLPDGTTGVVQVSRKKEARKVLLYELQRQRLPRGLAWEPAR